MLLMRLEIPHVGANNVFVSKLCLGLVTSEGAVYFGFFSGHCISQILTWLLGRLHSCPGCLQGTGRLILVMSLSQQRKKYLEHSILVLSRVCSHAPMAS